MKELRKASPLSIAGCAAIVAFVAFTTFKAKGPQRDVFVYPDISNQNPKSLDRTAKETFECQRNLGSNAKVKINLFAHAIDTVYAGDPLSTVNDFIEAVGHRLNKPTPHMHVPGTFTDKVLDDIVAQYGPDREAVIITDGDLDDASDAVIAKIKQDVAYLVKDASFVRLTMIGVSQENRRQWDKWLEPLGSKKGVYGTDDYEQALDEVGR